MIRGRGRLSAPRPTFTIRSHSNCTSWRRSRSWLSQPRKQSVYHRVGRCLGCQVGRKRSLATTQLDLNPKGAASLKSNDLVSVHDQQHTAIVARDREPVILSHHPSSL